MPINPADLTKYGTISAAQDAVTMTSIGMGQAAVQIAGTFTATLQFEVTASPPSSTETAVWVAASATPAAGGSAVSSATAPGAWTVPLAGWAQLRVRCSAYTSGPPAVRMTGGEAAGGGGGGASPETGTVYSGAAPLTPKFAAIAAATSGGNTLVAAVATKKIRVLALCLVAGAAGDIYFNSGAAGAVIFGGSANKIKLAANGGFVLPFNPSGWFETAAGALLELQASSTGPFSGGLVYVEV